MTTDRDRVEAWTAYCEADPEAGEVERRAFCTGWQAAADALAPPPVPMAREAVASAIASVAHPLTGLRDLYRMADAVLALLPAAPPPTGRRVRHVKRGSVYTVLGDAAAQVDTQGGIDTTKLDWRRSRLIHEGDVFVVYRGDEGALYARPADEFNDGRFEPIADAPAPAAPPPVPMADHKWFDPECGVKGCQSLHWRHLYEQAVKGRADFRQAYRDARARTAAPPPVPEDVRRLSKAYDQAREEWRRVKGDVAAPYGTSYGAQIVMNTAWHAFLEASAKWVRSLLATPAPPADTGDGRRWRVGRRVPVNVYRDDVVAAQFQRPEWTAEAVSALNRVRELEEALRELIGLFDRDCALFCAAEYQIEVVTRARAIIGGSND